MKRQITVSSSNIYEQLHTEPRRSRNEDHLCGDARGEGGDGGRWVGQGGGGGGGHHFQEHRSVSSSVLLCVALSCPD